MIYFLRSFSSADPNLMTSICNFLFTHRGHVPFRSTRLARLLHNLLSNIYHCFSIFATDRPASNTHDDEIMNFKNLQSTMFMHAIWRFCFVLFSLFCSQSKPARDNPFTPRAHDSPVKNSPPDEKSQHHNKPNESQRNQAGKKSAIPAAFAYSWANSAWCWWSKTPRKKSCEKCNERDLNQECARRVASPLPIWPRFFTVHPTAKSASFRQTISLCISDLLLVSLSSSPLSFSGWLFCICKLACL